MADVKSPFGDAFRQGAGQAIGQALPYFLMSLFPKKQPGASISPEEAQLLQLKAQLVGRNLAYGQSMEPVARRAMANLFNAIPGGAAFANQPMPDFGPKDAPIFQPSGPMERTSAGSYTVRDGQAVPTEQKKKGGGIGGFFKKLATGASFALPFIPIPGLAGNLPLAMAVRGGIGAGLGAATGGKRGALAGGITGAASPALNKVPFGRILPKGAPANMANPEVLRGGFVRPDLLRPRRF